MKICRTFCGLFWAILHCLIYLVLTSEEDLADFDFVDRKEIEWNYETERLGSQPTNTAEQNFMKPSARLDEYEEENHIRPFNWRESILKSALSKALTNVSLRQKFVEVMPILRVLSSQQRLALSALISAQITHGIKLDQVRKVFGDDKKLLLPIVYDIANLVHSSARKYSDFDFNIPAPESQSQYKEQVAIDRRISDLYSAELSEDGNDKNIGSLFIPDIRSNNDLSLEDIFSETGEEMLDPQSINEELQEVNKNIPASIINATNIITSKSITGSAQRTKRSVETSEFVHKLIRSVPLSINEDNSSHLAAENFMKLNTTEFFSSKDLSKDLSGSNNIPSIMLPDIERKSIADVQIQSTQSYQEVEDLAFGSFNGTVDDLLLATESPDGTLVEPLPSPEELIAGPRYRISSNRMHSPRPKLPVTKRKRVQVSRMPSKVPVQSNIGEGAKTISPPKKCERFTSFMCIRTEDYPLDQIMGSIRRHKNAMTALLADYQDKTAQLEITEDIDDFSIRRREDDAAGGGMCQSIVRYARPQKARSASGEWKYIVNTGQHTQTLRLEKCSTPYESCSYLAHSYRSHCTQVYNYHRLLSWDKFRGLHVDIFKVPTCCSCQVDGFRQKFPPLSGSKTKDFTPAFGVDVYSTINEDIDYSDEQEEDDLSYRFNNGLRVNHKKHDAGYDTNELSLGSQSVRTKLHSPNPTLGSYLSPPGGEEEFESFDNKNEKHRYQRVGSSSSHSSSIGKKIVRDPSRRRPYKSPGTTHVYNEARIDLDFSPSELHPEKEVNLSGGSLASPNKRVPQKRQRIHSVPHTATISTKFSAATETSTISSSIHKAAGIATPSTTTASVGVVGNRVGIATNAYQTSAPSPIYEDASQKQTNFTNIRRFYQNRQFINNSGDNQKPRFRSAAKTTPRTIPSPTEHSSIFQNQKSTPAQSQHVPPYHINSIYHYQYNENRIAESVDTDQTSSGPGPKRINYSYHPIIDFFVKHKHSAEEAIKKEFNDSSGQIYPYTITKSHISDQLNLDKYQSRERRVGSGVSSSNEKSRLVLRDRTGSSVGKYNNFNSDDNFWHPVIIGTKELS